MNGQAAWLVMTSQAFLKLQSQSHSQVKVIVKALTWLKSWLYSSHAHHWPLPYLPPPFFVRFWRIFGTFFGTVLAHQKGREKLKGRRSNKNTTKIRPQISNMFWWFCPVHYSGRRVTNAVPNIEVTTLYLSWLFFTRPKVVKISSFFHYFQTIYYIILQWLFLLSSFNFIISTNYFSIACLVRTCSN